MKNEQKECKAVRLLERVGSYIKEYISAYGIADRVDVDNRPWSTMCIEKERVDTLLSRMIGEVAVTEAQREYLDMDRLEIYMFVKVCLDRAISRRFTGSGTLAENTHRCVLGAIVRNVSLMPNCKEDINAIATALCEYTLSDNSDKSTSIIDMDECELKCAEMISDVLRKSNDVTTYKKSAKDTRKILLLSQAGLYQYFSGDTMVKYVHANHLEKVLLITNFINSSPIRIDVSDIHNDRHIVCAMSMLWRRDNVISRHHGIDGDVVNAGKLHAFGSIKSSRSIMEKSHGEQTVKITEVEPTTTVGIIIEGDDK